MKILFTMNLPYVPAIGGANKSNRYMLESLAGRGHEVRAVVPLRGLPDGKPLEQAFALIAQEAVIRCRGLEAVDYELNGVTVSAACTPGHVHKRLCSEIASFRPDWILVSSEDPSQILLKTALASPCDVAYLARTTSMLPFGTQSFFPSELRTRFFGGVTVIVAVSQFMAQYIRQWTGLTASTAPLQFFGQSPFPDLSCFDRGFVTMINPCAVKGISIFLELSRSFSHVPFAAVPTWGTNRADRDALAELANVRLLPASEDIDEILRVTKILLVPSLWGEAKSRVITEAMLRGIPVLASDSGGNREAKLGTDCVIPVKLVERFGDKLDENMLPTPLIPVQDLSPWNSALSAMLTDRNLYEHQSAASRQAALEFVAGLSVEPLEQTLVQNQGAPRLKDRPLRGGKN